MTSKTAAVVGAGLAGLTTAYRLQQAGFAVTVFEREAAPSGRIKSVYLNGCVIDTGATVFLPAYRETLALIDELGLGESLQPIRGKIALLGEGEQHLIDMDAPLKSLFTRVISWRSKLSLLRLLFKFLAVRTSLNFVSLGTARGKDDETLLDYCRRSLPQEVYDTLLNPALKFLYLHNGESGSLMELLWWLHATGWGKPRSLRNGSSSLTDALASRLRVQTGAEVMQLSRHGAGVQLLVKHAEGMHSTHEADVCIVAVPGTVAAAICKDGLSENQRCFLQSRRYDPSIVVSFHTRHQPAADVLMFMLPDTLYPELATVIFGHHIGPERAPAGQGIINAYFIKDWSQQHATDSDEVVMRAAQARISTLVPEVQDLLSWNVQRWSHTAAISEVGDCERIARYEAEIDPSSPIQLIGDYQAQASMNVAVATANRVAAQMARQHQNQR